MRYPRDVYRLLEERTGRQLDQGFIDWFSEQPGKELYDWYFYLKGVSKKEVARPKLPPLAAGAVRPFVSAPTYAPTPAHPETSDQWQTWWHRGTCALLLCTQVAMTEPLLRALLWDQSSEPPRGEYGAVRSALTTLASLRKLVEAGVIFWVNATNNISVLELSPKYMRASLNGWSPASFELAETLADVEICRQIGKVNPIIRNDFKGRELKDLQWFLGDNKHEATFEDLCNLKLPMLTLNAAQLAGLRTTADSFESFRNNLQQALLRLPSQVRDDPSWRKSATAFMTEALTPSYELVKRDLNRSSTLAAARIAGKSVIFSVVAMEVGSVAGGGASTWPAVASSATAAALSATADFTAARRQRANKKEYLRILGNFLGSPF